VEANVIALDEAANVMPVDNVKLSNTDIMGIACNVPAYPVKFSFLKFPISKVNGYVPPVKLKLILFTCDKDPKTTDIAVDPDEVTLTTWVPVVVSPVTSPANPLVSQTVPVPEQ
jgi:hypothetical protein